MNTIEETGGTKSSFGPQVLSQRQTWPRTKIGTEQRSSTDKLAGFDKNRLGGTSLGVMTNTVSSIGPQHASVRHTAPAHRFGNRYVSDHDMGKEARPGPGSYETPPSVGKQLLSPKPNQPSWRIGTGSRFSTYKTVWRADMQTPGASDPRPESGWLGDAPKFSFHGAAKRADISTGLPGQKPTSHTDPGPGMYELPGAIGPQHDSRKASAWRTRVGTATRDGITKKQYISAEHERDLTGKHSPAPNMYNPTKALAMTSRVQTPSSFRFGSGDRFSQVKPREVRKRTLPGPIVPGPGSYVV